MELAAPQKRLRRPARRCLPSARALRAWREDTDQSLSAVASRLGVTKNAVYNWESGQRQPASPYWFAIHRISGGVVPALGWLGDDEQSILVAAVVDRLVKEIDDPRVAAVVLGCVRTGRPANDTRTA